MGESPENKPTKEDIVKLHEEINQSVNSRLTVTTAAIGLFGVMVGFIISSGIYSTEKNGVKDFHSQPIIILLLSSALLLFLDFLYSYCQEIAKQVNVLAAYLVVTKASTWEDHYQRYFLKFYKDSGRGSLELVFTFLGISSAIIPVILLVIFPPNSWYDPNLIRVIIIFVVSVLCSGSLFWKLWKDRSYVDYRKEATNRWKDILFNMPQTEDHMDQTEQPKPNHREDISELYDRIRRKIEHEDHLVNQRLTWLITLHGLLFTAYGFSIGAEGSALAASTNPDLLRNFNNFMEIVNGLRNVIVIVGIASSFVALLGVVAANLAIRHDEEILNKAIHNFFVKNNDKYILSILNDNYVQSILTRPIGTRLTNLLGMSSSLLVPSLGGVVWSWIGFIGWKNWNGNNSSIHPPIFMISIIISIIIGVVSIGCLAFKSYNRNN